MSAPCLMPVLRHPEALCRILLRDLSDSFSIRVVKIFQKLTESKARIMLQQSLHIDLILS